MIDIFTTHDAPSRPIPSVEWLNSPAKPALQVASAIDRVRRTPSILEAIRSKTELLRVTADSLNDGIRPAYLMEPIREAISDASDTVTGLAAVHALALLPGSVADADLADLVFDAAPGFEEHAAWAAGERTPTPWLIDVMAGALPRGGVTGMHAQAALARWSSFDGATVLAALERHLQRAQSESSRRHIVETIGLVRTRAARLALERVATDASEPESVRTTAIAAFAELGGDRLRRSIGRLAVESGRIGHAVRLVRAQRRLGRRGRRRAVSRTAGIRVAQIHLGAVLDASMSRAGMGDTGGVATLVSRLGSSLAAQPRIAEVISIGRTPPGSAGPASRTRAGHRFEYVPLEDGEGSTFASTWPSLVAAQRGIRTALLATGIPDVMHLRMADPGSLAGALVAQEFDIPTVFTLAPDPHAPIAEAERTGELTRRQFATEDARTALWFRTDLIEQLAAQAREIALFPRPRLRERLQDLLGIDIAAGPPRYTVVAEGVDTQRADTAATRVASAEAPAILKELDAAVAALPAARHGLPLAVTVGRMHEIKGMARIVAAFAADASLEASANLVVVGGDLSAPTPTEVAELSRIEAILESDPELRDRVILLGHRPNDDVALVLAAARAGWGENVGRGGAYVCGGRKEEFGLAIVEAMAAGLPVVAPRSGGPASYVQPGVTGSLVDTSDPAAMAAGLHSALSLASDEGTARKTRATVEDRYTLDRMARTLAAIYRVSTGAGTLSLPIDEEVAA